MSYGGAKMRYLPTDHKFTIWRDEDGDYVIQSEEKQGLITHGKTPDEAIVKMAETIPEFEAIEKGFEDLDSYDPEWKR